MNQRQAFIQDIAEHLYEDDVRLVFADWLDDHDDPERAEFIRLQVELEPLRDRYEIPRAVELHERETKLLQGKNWLGELPDGCDDWRSGVAIEFRRGFPDLLRCPTRSFIAYGAGIRAAHPTIRRAVVHCLNGWGERLAACDGLRGLAELELACWYGDDAIQALAQSAHLRDLQVLVLWLGRSSTVGTDAALCRLATEATAWPKLRELVLLDPEGDIEGKVLQFVAEANGRLGRPVARYERGYPELFPLNGQFYYDWPVAGRLGDGRAAVLDRDKDRGADGNTVITHLIVRTFDAAGAPTGEEIRLPLPPGLGNLPLHQLENWDGRYTQVARAALGFEPGCIRVQAYAISDEFGPRRGHYDNWDLCGYADDPEGDAERETGIGGMIYHYVRDVEFVVGHDAWADKTGSVHST